MGNHFLCRTLSSHSPSGSSLSTYLVIRRLMERMRYTALFSIIMMMMILILWQWLPMMCQNVLTSQRPSSGVLFQCSQTPRENDQAGLITKLQCKQGPKSGRNIILHPLPPSLSSFSLFITNDACLLPCLSDGTHGGVVHLFRTHLYKKDAQRAHLWTFRGSPLNLCLLCKRIDNTAVSHNFM